MPSIHPITLSAMEVQAILEGRKTQMREVIDSPPDENYVDTHYSFKEAKYKIGDILYQQDEWRIIHVNHSFKSGDFFSVQFMDFTATDYNEKLQDELREMFYSEPYEIKEDPSLAFGSWRSAESMPMEVSGIFLKITGIKVERLQSISIDDAANEGHTFSQLKKVMGVGNGYNFEITLKEIFAESWKAKYGDESWNENPFVFVYSFENCYKPLI